MGQIIALMWYVPLTKISTRYLDIPTKLLFYIIHSVFSKMKIEYFDDIEVYNLYYNCLSFL